MKRDPSSEPSAVVERWLLAGDSQQLCPILGEITDLYLATDPRERQSFAKSQMVGLVQQVLAKLDAHDDTLRLTCLRLLQLIARDNAALFVDIMHQTYSWVQALLDDRSRVVRRATLALAATIAAQVCP
ncbi:hypothetical protein B484DRAFT_393860 [Ochromonadaceae sp. CCMP2298]|nr:hypothetical protein B484DRAFT_393860 [Ochromonadaceae sp. CCMP2298]